MKKYFFILFLLLTVFSAPKLVLKAIAANPSASPSETETTTELKKRIEKAVEEKREQIKGALQGIESERRGLIGEVQRVTDEAITIKSKDETIIIPITSNIQLTRRNIKIDIDDVAVGNWAVIIGVESGTGDFEVESVSISTESLLPKPQLVMLGTIDTITAKEIVIISRLDGNTTAFTISKNSVIQNNDGSNLLIRNFQKDMQVLIVGTDNNGSIELKTMRALATIE